MESIYIELALDSLYAALLFPFDGELFFHAMVVFGGYDTTYIFIAAMIGSMAGYSVNFGVGWFIAKESGIYESLNERIVKASSIFNRYIVWLLIFTSFISIFGSILTFFSGIFRTRFAIVLSLVFISKAGYYIYTMMM